MKLSKSQSRYLLYTLQLISALFGIALCIYLLVQHTRLKNGIQGSASFCTLGQFADCDVVNASAYSELLGIPLATIGAAYYFLLLIFGLIGWPGSIQFRRTQRWMAWLATLSLIVDTPLFCIQLFDLHTLCLMCFLTYLVTLVHLIANVAMLDGAGKGIWQRFKQALSLEKGTDLQKLPIFTWPLAILSFICFIGALWLLPSMVKISSQAYSYVENQIEQFYQEWKTKPGRKIEIKEGDGTFGNPNAKVQVVEFSDFECPHCRRAAFTLHTALKPLKERVHFIFKHFPLDSACNPLLIRQMHPYACKLARLAYCAVKKGNFWDYHDQVFFTLAESSSGFDQIADGIRGIFSKDEVSQCFANEKSLQSISEDIQLANNMEVKYTPSIFINGKLVTIPITVDTIRKLVELEESSKQP